MTRKNANGEGTSSNAQTTKICHPVDAQSVPDGTMMGQAGYRPQGGRLLLRRSPPPPSETPLADGAANALEQTPKALQGTVTAAAATTLGP